MSTTIRLLEYFSVQAPHRAGEAARLLAQLKDAGIDLLALSAFPRGRRAQIDLVPADGAAFRTVAKEAGWKLTGPKNVFLIAGEDRVGAMEDPITKLAIAKIDITATHAVGARARSFAALLWVAPRDVRAAAKVLGVR
jgi:hypothetical protein